MRPAPSRRGRSSWRWRRRVRIAIAWPSRSPRRKRRRRSAELLVLDLEAALERHRDLEVGLLLVSDHRYVPGEAHVEQPVDDVDLHGVRTQVDVGLFRSLEDPLADAAEPVSAVESAKAAPHGLRQLFLG